MSNNSSSTTSSTSDQSDLDSDGDPDFSSDIVPPSPKQPCVEPEDISPFSIDVADVAERRSVLTETEKYDFYINHASPGLYYKFPRVAKFTQFPVPVPPKVHMNFKLLSQHQSSSHSSMHSTSDLLHC